MHSTDPAPPPQHTHPAYTSQSEGSGGGTRRESKGRASVWGAATSMSQPGKRAPPTPPGAVRACEWRVAMD